jgi:hypothetical protein
MARSASATEGGAAVAQRLRYRSLDAAKIVGTARKLHERIRERFPESNLTHVASEFLEAADETVSVAASLARPVFWLRAVTGTSILLLMALFVATLLFANSNVAPFSSIADYLQGLDAMVNQVVLVGIAIFFLLTIETRFKRRRALKALHVLRSFAHIIDMHQLTKDPERMAEAQDVSSAPAHDLSPFELTRYLDYCSEMLAVISKLAALHVQEFRDPVTLSAVNDIEELTQGLSRKIWQKIMILDRIMR